LRLVPYEPILLNYYDAAEGIQSGHDTDADPLSLSKRARCDDGGETRQPEPDRNWELRNSPRVSSQCATRSLLPILLIGEKRMKLSDLSPESLKKLSQCDGTGLLKSTKDQKIGSRF
jgi:hypothetical protein